MIFLYKSRDYTTKYGHGVKWFCDKHNVMSVHLTQLSPIFQDFMFPKYKCILTGYKKSGN
jgi:hypothetical protein